MSEIREVDALVVGAGMGGVLSLHKLVNELGLDAVAIDRAPALGGTWYWNRYPGALSDTESHMYQFPLECDLFRRTNWKSRYVTASQIRSYLENAVDFWALRERVHVSVELTSAKYEEDRGTWLSETSAGTFRSRFLIAALGLLSTKNKPAFPHFDDFAGEVVHTTEWPEDLDLSGKRVGVIGNGSTGIQLMTELAKVVGHLTTFQRTPQYSVPAGNREYTDEEVAGFKARCQDLWDAMETSKIGFGINETERKYADFTDEERERIFEEAWSKGGNFVFTHETFADVTTDREANLAAGEFIKKKIRQTVKDPVTAQALLPEEIFARRPICDSGYFEIFNQENVKLVNLREAPIEKFVESGVVTSDGVQHDLDVLILATGFDAIEGSYRGLDIRGRNGETLAEHWSDGAKTHMGVSVAGFPNMFTVLGPLGPFVNIPPAIAIQVRWIKRVIAMVQDDPQVTIEVSAEAEEAWLQECLRLLEGSLFLETSSWIFGKNIPGKNTSRTASYYTGGLNRYIEIGERELSAGLPNYTIHSRASA